MSSRVVCFRFPFVCKIFISFNGGDLEIFGRAGYYGISPSAPRNQVNVLIWLQLKPAHKFDLKPCAISVMRLKFILLASFRHKENSTHFLAISYGFGLAEIEIHIAIDGFHFHWNVCLCKIDLAIFWFTLTLTLLHC